MDKVSRRTRRADENKLSDGLKLLIHQIFQGVMNNMKRGIRFSGEE